MRKNKPKDELELERLRIESFLMDRLKPWPGYIEMTMHIYDEYVKVTKSKMSVDSFGRLFPKQYKRKLFYHEGKLGRGISGWRLV